MISFNRLLNFFPGRIYFCSVKIPVFWSFESKWILAQRMRIQLLVSYLVGLFFFYLYHHSGWRLCISVRLWFHQIHRNQICWYLLIDRNPVLLICILVNGVVCLNLLLAHFQCVEEMISFGDLLVHRMGVHCSVPSSTVNTLVVAGCDSSCLWIFCTLIWGNHPQLFKQIFALALVLQREMGIIILKSIVHLLPQVGIYRSGTVNSDTVNSKFHLIRSFFEYLSRFLSFHV